MKKVFTGFLLRMKFKGSIVRMISPNSPFLKHDEHPFQLRSKSFLESHLYATSVRHNASSTDLLDTAKAQRSLVGRSSRSPYCLFHRFLTGIRFNADIVPAILTLPTLLLRRWHFHLPLGFNYTCLWIGYNFCSIRTIKAYRNVHEHLSTLACLSLFS